MFPRKGRICAASKLCHALLTSLRRFMAAHPERWDYSQTAIPSALTEEMEQYQEARAVRLFDP